MSLCVAFVPPLAASQAFCKAKPWKAGLCLADGILNRAPAVLCTVGIHAENEFNNRCDELAVMESHKFM